MKAVESLNIGPRPFGAGGREGLHGHLGQLGPQTADFGFLLGHSHFGVGDIGLELGLLVDRHDVPLGEDVGLLVELIELLEDPIDLALGGLDPLGLVDGGFGTDGGGKQRRSDDAGAHDDDGDPGEEARGPIHAKPKCSES